MDDADCSVSQFNTNRFFSRTLFDLRLLIGFTGFSKKSSFYLGLV